MTKMAASGPGYGLEEKVAVIVGMDMKDHHFTKYFENNDMSLSGHIIGSLTFTSLLHQVRPNRSPNLYYSRLGLMLGSLYSLHLIW